jgi:hypothetical protein
MYNSYVDKENIETFVEALEELHNVAIEAGEFVAADIFKEALKEMLDLKDHIHVSEYN